MLVPSCRIPHANDFSETKLSKLSVLMSLIIPSLARFPIRWLHHIQVDNKHVFSCTTYSRYIPVCYLRLVSKPLADSRRNAFSGVASHPVPLSTQWNPRSARGNINIYKILSCRFIIRYNAHFQTFIFPCQFNFWIFFVTIIRILQLCLLLNS